jgi:hypothetical protein
MIDERAPALARRLTAHGRLLRRGRIFARLREGWAYDEIASQERLTAERVRQIVWQALDRRIIDEGRSTPNCIWPAFSRRCGSPAKRSPTATLRRSRRS